MTASLHTLSGELLDPRIAGLERTPGFWRGRAAVRMEEARALYAVSQQRSAHQVTIAQCYIDNAMRLEK